MQQNIEDVQMSHCDLTRAVFFTLQLMSGGFSVYLVILNILCYYFKKKRSLCIWYITMLDLPLEKHLIFGKPTDQFSFGITPI